MLITLILVNKATAFLIISKYLEGYTGEYLLEE
jgi:hypothetical protein